MLFDRESQILEHLFHGAEYASDLVNASRGPIRLGTVHRTSFAARSWWVYLASQTGGARLETGSQFA
jgi:hypothetical protein